MTTAEAATAALIAHGIGTVYALPGVHNDHLFDAFQRAGDRLGVVHTRHEQGWARRSPPESRRLIRWSRDRTCSIPPPPCSPPTG
jgi:cytosine/adenosine deaminase-related metal-dependent hydrolase